MNNPIKVLDDLNYPWILRVINIFRSLENLDPILKAEIPKFIKYPSYNLDLNPEQAEFLIQRLWFQFLIRYETEAWNKFSEWVKDGGFGDINEEPYTWADVDFTSKDKMDDVMMYLFEIYVDNGF